MRSLMPCALAALGAALVSPPACAEPAAGADGARPADSALRADPAAPAEPAHLAFFDEQVLPLLERSCLRCHGGRGKVKAGLRLTSRASILHGGDTGPAVDLEAPGESLLLRAVRYEGPEMPPKGKLASAEIDVLARWVEMGLPYSPEAEKVPPPPEEHAPLAGEDARSLWSFQPLGRPPVPEVRDADWVRTPIDAFILARLEAEGLRPAPPAEKATLLRRAHYGMTGLPPTSAEVEAFLAGDSETGYESLIDDLLRSPRYGEKWGRHWLDLVHYAESNSFERDNPKPEVWRYRDWVIRSFNEDKPYDRFVLEQIAGDELDPVTPESIIATGYYRLGLWDDESPDPPKTRFDELDDWVTVTSQVFLGLTMNCARCHDHKIDPLPQEDYYRFLAFFRGVRSFQAGRDGHGKGFNERNFLARLSELVTDEEQEAARRDAEPLEARAKELAAAIDAIEAGVAPKLPAGVRDDFRYPANRLRILREVAGELIEPAELERYERLVEESAEIERRRSLVDARVLCVKGTREPPETHVFIRGNPGANGARVEPGIPAVLGGHALPPAELPDRASSSGRRLALARWITSPENSLTARVIANRIWQHHFGRGIVATPNDFGVQGDRPSHPELLDWLASELIAGGWRLKPLHRLILASSTYRMSSRLDSEAFEKDPENRLLWSFELRRLAAEEIRDSILAVNGRLNLTAFGQSIYTEIPEAVLATQSQPGRNWKVSSEQERTRRSIYIHVKRSLVEPTLERFDFADTDSSCPVRFTTTQPTQALGMLNGDFIHREAEAFAERLRIEVGGDRRAQVELALRRALQRPVGSPEVARGVELIESLERRGASAHTALEHYCLMVYSLNEFLHVD